MIGGIGGGLGASQLQRYAALRGASGAMSGGARPGGPPSITLKTQEGDTVTITGKTSPSATYGPSGKGGSLAALNLQSNDQFDVTISGNLSEQERSDIQATLTKMDATISTLSSGDFGAGMQAMQSAMQGGGTVASVSGPGGPPPGGMPPGDPTLAASDVSGMSGTSDSSSTDTLLSMLDSSSDDDSSGTTSALLSSGTKKSSQSHHSKSEDSLVSLLSSSNSNSSIDEFLSKVLNGL